MPTSISGTAPAADGRRVLIPASAPRGFTLLEVLVVMTLMVLVSTLLVVGALRAGSGNPVAKASGELVDVFSLMTEQSLFRGDLLALRLDADGWQPLRYDVDTAEFVPLPAPLAPRRLDESVQLEWQLHENRDRDRPSLSQVADILLPEKSDSDTPEPPQVFFFPSGEVTPITLLLRQIGGDTEQVLLVDPLGQVTLPEEAP
ncbi:MAG: type II secretion system minor pseudopilin GspH [Alcanivoracaceae bacterium]